MSDNHNLPALPDFEALQNKVTLIGQDGNAYQVEGVSTFDFIPETGQYLPFLYAGQSEDKKQMYKEGKQTVYPLDKKLCIGFREFAESDDSDKPEQIVRFEPFSDNEILMYPVAIDATNKFWAGSYDPDNLTEPDCQSNAFFLRPVPDERYLQRDQFGKVVNAKYSASCMALDSTLKLRPHCAKLQWVDGRPSCIQFIHVYGLVWFNGKLELVEGRFKRASYKSGEKLLHHYRKMMRDSKPLYTQPIRIKHAIASEEKGGYTYYGLLAGTDATHLDYEIYADEIETAKSRALEVISASRARADIRPDTSNAPIDGEIIVEDGTGEKKLPF